MCLILFAYRTHPRYELVLAANRDEFYARPSAPMHFWEETPDLLAGRDLQAGGTWLGITRTGRFAAITNYRDPGSVRPNAPSRGHLVSDFLKGQQPAWNYLNRLVLRGKDYNGFNLLLRDSQGLYYYSNEDAEPRTLEAGIYGLSNHLLNTPWPKVERGRCGLTAVLEKAQPSRDSLLDLLADRTRAQDEELPHTGVSLEWERTLSAMLIESPHYGTRSSTALTIENTGRVWLAEKTWDDGSVREFELCWRQGYS